MRAIALFIAAATLAGCTMPFDDLRNNDFVSVQPQPAPSDIAGVWTGSAGPYLMTLIINSDGTGSHCYTWGESNVLERLKFDGNQVRIQDGSRLKVYRSGYQLIGQAPYTGSQPINFVQDSNLANASVYCAKNL
ncbi:J517_1871 family lipoprotein [Metapseudomonas resinovorans]|uniref:J517_1871 family lipoprotein n=1 Tax=Metapseudomonas resinovorans TaxID=53412 RepID=UPI000403254C|nr:J517_1871 family lipoprotein [Pseudomonas resinovorans]